MAIALLEEEISPPRIAARIGCSAESVRNLKRAAAKLPTGEVPRPKSSPRRPRKTSKKTDAIMKREIMQDLSLTAAGLIKKHPELLKDDLGLGPSPVGSLADALLRLRTDSAEQPILAAMHGGEISSSKRAMALPLASSERRFQGIKCTENEDKSNQSEG